MTTDIVDSRPRRQEQAHRRAVSAPLTQIATELQGLLSPRLTAYIAGVRDTKRVARWASGDLAGIRDHLTEQRLRGTYEVAQIMLPVEGPETTRSWFIGMNPRLGDVSPAEAIHDGPLSEALAVVHLFSAGY